MRGTRRWCGWAAVGMVLLGSAACGDVERQPRQPNERPTAVLSVPAEARVQTAVLFDASQSSDPDGAIAEYRFNPGDTAEELIAAEPLLEYEYATAGEFTVTLTVVDDRGGKDSVAAILVVR